MKSCENNWDSESVDSILEKVKEKEQPPSFPSKFSENLEKARKYCRKSNLKPQVWLGGPGENSDCYSQRCLLHRLLEELGLEVIKSEEFVGINGKRQPKKEELIDTYGVFMIIVFPISYGSIAESVLFALDEKHAKKLYIFIPANWNDGFVYKLLSAKTRGEHFKGDFELEKFKKCAEDLFADFCLEVEMRRAQHFPFWEDLEKRAQEEGFKFP